MAEGIRHDLLDEPERELLGYLPTESFFNNFKNERVRGTRYETLAESIADTFDYIEPFHNRRHRHSTLGYTSPPQDYLANWIKSQHEDELAA